MHTLNRGDDARFLTQSFRGRGGKKQEAPEDPLLRRPAKSLITRVYDALTAYFLPQELYANRETANQARMFLLSHFFGPFLGLTVPLVLYLLDPTPGLEVVLIGASIMGFWLFPFLMRAGMDYRLLVALSVTNLHFAILTGCYNYGGVTAPTVIWVLIIPILCVFYTGGAKETNLRLLVVSLGSFACYFLIYNVFPPSQNDLSDAANLGIGIVSTVATLCYVGMMAIYYARIFHAGVDLEMEVQRRRRLAAELRDAVVAANRASASKSEFLARMSHELRTPLNAIMGYSQLLREEAADTDDQALVEDVDRILDAGEYLVRLVDLILDLSKIEAGRMQLYLKPCEIGRVVEEVADRRREAIAAGGNELTLDLDSAPAEASVDQAQLRKVIDAILENAAQHTRNGSITVGSRSFRHDGRTFFTVFIEDTGSGIEPEILPSIMESFESARHAAGGRYGGTGLSLTVASKLCQVMGGRIDVESRLGQGSRFTITLPIDGEEDVRQRAAAATPVSPPRPDEPLPRPAAPRPTLGRGPVRV